MSWDATLYAADGDAVFDQNYTHNTNLMIERAIGDAIAATRTPFWAGLNPETGMGRGSWWDLLDGSSGADGTALLRAILEKFDAEPAAFRAMNPPNGWGDFDRLRIVLRAMADTSEQHPHGKWEVGG